MSEKRRDKRFPKRMRVEYGERDYSISSVTGNISKGGAFILAGRVPPPGTWLHLKLYGANDKWFALEGRVQWAKEVEASLRSVQRGGFGVAFLSPSQLLGSLVEQLNSGKSLELVYDSQAAFQGDWENQFRHGGAFVPTTEPFASEAEVTLSLQLRYSQQVLDLPAKVLQVMTQGQKGVALVFTQKNEALDQIRGKLTR